MRTTKKITIRTNEPTKTQPKPPQRLNQIEIEAKKVEFTSFRDDSFQ
jgi:hypothetical protein